MVGAVAVAAISNGARHRVCKVSREVTTGDGICIALVVACREGKTKRKQKGGCNLVVVVVVVERFVQRAKKLGRGRPTCTLVTDTTRVAKATLSNK